MRNQVIALLKDTNKPMYAHEQGEPFTTCLAHRVTLIKALNREIVLDSKSLIDLMDALKREWDNVIIARKRAMGARITEAYVTSSQEMTDFVSYLNYLSEVGYAQVELDQIYVTTLSSVLGDN